MNGHLLILPAIPQVLITLHCISTKISMHAFITLNNCTNVRLLFKRNIFIYSYIHEMCSLGGGRFQKDGIFPGGEVLINTNITCSPV